MDTDLSLMMMLYLSTAIITTDSEENMTKVDWEEPDRRHSTSWPIRDEYCGSSSTNHSSPGRRPAPRSCG